jgi:AraC-like DNA-binding protein
VGCEMRACKDVEELLADPIGRCVSGSCWLYFYARQDLCGFAMWGKPDLDVMNELVRALSVELGSVPHRSLVDMRGLEGVEPAAFDRLGRYVVENHAELSRAVTKLALVRPTNGLMAAVVAGFFDVAGAPYPVSLFESPELAMDWLEIADGRELLLEIERERQRTIGEPQLLRQLRAWIESHLADAGLDAAALALNVSSRSLQRRLMEENTSFQSEVRAVQVAVAQRLLRETDLAITRIALDVHLSPAHFSTLFRGATGMSPSEWRRVASSAASTAADAADASEKTAKTE